MYIIFWHYITQQFLLLPISFGWGNKHSSCDSTAEGDMIDYTPHDYYMWRLHHVVRTKGIHVQQPGENHNSPPQDKSHVRAIYGPNWTLRQVSLDVGHCHHAGSLGCGPYAREIINQHYLRLSTQFGTKPWEYFCIGWSNRKLHKTLTCRKEKHILQRKTYCLPKYFKSTFSRRQD